MQTDVEQLQCVSVLKGKFSSNGMLSVRGFEILCNLLCQMCVMLGRTHLCEQYLSASDTNVQRGHD